MAVYKGTISGTGNSDTRENEITPDGLAVVRNFECGYTDYQNTGGVVKDEGHDFDILNEITLIDEDNLVYSLSGNPTTINLTDGLCFAYGYFGGMEAVNITILPPAVEQYHIVYAELDRSVIPNACAIKVKNNQASAIITANTFRQDILSTVKTGVYQLPLWLLKITNKGIEEVTDLRKLRQFIEHVVYSDNATHVMNNGTLGDNVTCPTPDGGDISKKVANTAFVDKAIQTEINR